MDTLVWIATGGLIGWIGCSVFGFNEARGRNVSIILGAVGGLFGAKAIAPMFVTIPAGSITAASVMFAALAALAVLAAGNMVYNRWGV